MSRLQTIVGDIRGGLVASTACIAFSIANGALIYSGTLQPMLRAGIAAGLLTTAVTAIVLALASTFRPVIGTANSTTAAPLGAIMVSTAPSLAHLPPETAAATVVALVAVTTLLTGLLLVLLGSARLGTIVRFIPFPVVAGFMGVTGTLLTLGAIRFGTGVGVVWRDLPRFLAPDTAGLLVLTLAFAGLTTVVTRRFKHPLVLPALLLAAILATDALTYATGHTIEAPPIAGLFLVPKTAIGINLPLPLHLPLAADWSVIPPLFGSIAAYVVLVVIATLLTSTGLEAALNVDANYDREVRAQGLACVASGLCGGFVANPSVGSTMASVAMGARSPLAGITNGVAVAAALVFALPLIVFIPRFVLGGLLAHLGIWIIITWCVATRLRMPRGEWLVVLGIVAITVYAGMVPAILAGLVAGCILFALDMSRISVVKRQYGLDRRASIVVRPSKELEVLTREGRRVRFIELGGMLFFGSAYQILALVKQIVVDRPDMIVLDLTRVTGCDSSTTAVISRMRKLLTRENIAFAVAGCSDPVLALLQTSGCLSPGDKTYPSTDRALEAAELTVLGGATDDSAFPDRANFDSAISDSSGSDSLTEWLAATLGDGDLARALAAELECSNNAPGTYICREGDPTDTLLFIETGRIRVMVGPPEAEVCVRVFGPHTIAGEHGFILVRPRTASLKVEVEARVWTLDRRRFETLETSRPALVIALLRNIVGLQSERLAFATRQNAALA